MPDSEARGAPDADAEAEVEADGFEGGLRTVGLGDVAPARSRHAGRRSAVALTDAAVVVGTADGTVRAFDRPSLDERWRAESGGASAGDGTADEGASVVAAEPFAGGVAVGTRGHEGEIRLHDAATGEVRWRYATADDVGAPERDTRFYLPYVAALAADGGRLFAAARRYERDGDRRAFESRVYAFDADGGVAWAFAADASPISVDARDGRVAVAYNRCPGDHQHGLVVLDAETGDALFDWDPGTSGERRVGDVSFVPDGDGGAAAGGAATDGVAVASHGDYRGYRLGPDGGERWRADLATPVSVDGETLYAYPNHVNATAAGVVFVTGNTYATEGRETDSLHPDEHAAFGHAPDGERRWSASVGGFASEVAAADGRVAVPGAQHFRTRDAGVHGLRAFDTAAGPRSALHTDGVVTAVAADAGAVAAVEEPVVYHDEGEERGSYRLLVGTSD